MKQILLLTVLFCSFISCFAVNMTNGASTAISTATTLYDPGGTSNYTSNLSVTHTFSPATAGQYVKVSFSAFDTESSFDYLYVYNGTNICTASLLGTFTGTTIPSDLTSSSPDGKLTFVFTSDGSTVRPGFTASLTQQTTIGSVAFAVCDLIMTSGGASTVGTTPLNFYDPGGVGGSGTGGTAGNYANSLNVTHTVCPATAGQYVSISFSAFATQAATDFLYVYNGSNPCAATLLGTFSGSSIPANITSSAPNGCLTFVFTSNGSTRGAGFTASLTQQTTVGGVAYTACVANDDCANAITLTSGSTCSNTAGSTQYASQSQAGCAGTADDDVWYKFVATNTTHTVTFSNVTGTSTDIVHQVFSGSCGALTSLGCHDISNSSTYTTLTIGNTYYVRVYTYYSGYNAQFDVCVTNPAPPPANDNCLGAVTLTPGTTCVPTAGSTSSATQSQAGCIGTADDDVWYKFTATSTSHSIDIANTGGATDIVSQVFTGSCASLTALAGTCSDNNSGQTLSGLTIGTTYYVRVYTYSSGVNSQFNICVGPPPPDCPDATKLCTDGSTLSFDTPQGTAPAGNDYGCLSTFPRPAWFYIEVDQPGNITYTLNGYNSSNSLVDNDYALWGPYSNLAAAQAACGTLPTPTACSYSTSATEIISIPSSTTGQVYLLLVTGYSTSSNHFTLEQTSGTGTTNCSSVVGACDISNIALSSITSCNNNSTASNSTDDYYTATVTITFANKPTTGTLELTGTGIHSGTYSVAVASTSTATTHVFTNVKIKANGVAASLNASFSALSACNMTKTFTAVTSCSACLTPPSVDIGPTTSSTCGTTAASFTSNITNGPASVIATGTGMLSTATLANGSTTFTYTPSLADAGTTVTITATVSDPDGIGPCSAATDVITLVVNTLNTANAGSDQTICAGSTVNLAGTIGGSATSGTWSAPSGSFSSASSLTSTYTPSIPSGTVVLTLTASGACADVSSTLTFTVKDCCPTSVVPTNYTANVCSGATTSTSTASAAADIVVNGAVIAGTDYTIQWFSYSDYIGTLPTTLTNTGTCNPIVVPLYAKVVCTHTGVTYNGGTALITVYPAPVAPTLEKIDNSCDYVVKLACPNVESTTFNPLGQLPGAAAATATITVTSLGGCSTVFPGIAYPSCSPCATTIVTANPSCCDPSTNQHSVEVVVSYANAIGGQPISVTIGGITVTGITPIKGASGIAVLTVNGLNSDGAIHSVAAQVGSSCVAPAGSYTAPASCGSCAPTNAGTIQN